MHGGKTPWKKDGSQSKYNPVWSDLYLGYQRFLGIGVDGLEDELALTRSALDYIVKRLPEDEHPKHLDKILVYIDRIQSLIIDLKKLQIQKTAVEAVADVRQVVQQFVQVLMDHSKEDRIPVVQVIEAANKYVEDSEQAPKKDKQ